MYKTKICRSSINCTYDYDDQLLINNTVLLIFAHTTFCFIYIYIYLTLDKEKTMLFLVRIKTKSLYLIDEGHLRK